MSLSWPSDPLRILLVVDDDEVARTVAASLGAGFSAGLWTCQRPEQAVQQAHAHHAAVVVIALRSIEAVERVALALQGGAIGTAGRPYLLALSEAGDIGSAARLCREGLLDDYVQHFPIPLDGERLAGSVRLAARIVVHSRVVPPHKAPERRRATVLLVEDDEVLHTLVAAMLDSEPVDLVFEADGALALDRIRALEPDLVLMDIVLPGGNGVAITEQLKGMPELAAIPVVMLTGEARLETLVRSMEAGAADFVVKPFTREALLAKVAKYLPARH